jgi:anthranilate phosphoribosyltransferase
MEETVSYAQYIKEIGRGAQGSRDLSPEEARQLYAAMLDGGVPDLELGAILIALRVKGESLDEMLGFMAAIDERMNLLDMPHGRVRPVVLPSYNGARKEANLTPLLALLLQRFGVPVLVHGLLEGYGRVTSAQILRELGHMPVGSAQQAQQTLEKRGWPSCRSTRSARGCTTCCRCAPGWACATAPTVWSSCSIPSAARRCWWRRRPIPTSSR